MQYTTVLPVLNTADDGKWPSERRHRATRDLCDTVNDLHDVAIQWYTPPTTLVNLGTSLYTIVVTDRAVRHTKAHVLMQTWSTATITIKTATFRPDHFLLAERPAVSYAVVDINESTATRDYNCYTAGDDNVNVADNTSRQCVKLVND